MIQHDTYSFKAKQRCQTTGCSDTYLCVCSDHVTVVPQSPQAPYITNDLDQLNELRWLKWRGYLLPVSDMTGKGQVCSPKSTRNCKAQFNSWKFWIFKVSSFSPLKIEEDHASLKFSCVRMLCVNTTFPSYHHYPDHAEITVGYLEPFRF